MEAEFWKKKPLSQMNTEEWEALCDGCGLCCFHKFITGRGRNTKIHNTRIACRLLDLSTFRCTAYATRFAENKECTHLTKKNAACFQWLPESCAYRLLHEGKTLPPWHPLLSGSRESVRAAGITVQDAVHEDEASDWEDYEIPQNV